MNLTWRGRTAYDLLEVAPDASDEELKAAYKFHAQAWHPDGFKDPEMKAEANDRFIKIKKAYDDLRDPLIRRTLLRSVSFTESEPDWTRDPRQSEATTWKRMAAWMKDEDVGRGFDRKMVFQAGDLAERGRRPSEKQIPFMLAAWDLALSMGFDVDE